MVSRSRLSREIPDGGAVAPLFPWWRTGAIQLGIRAGINQNERYVFTPGGIFPGATRQNIQSREAFIPNDMNRPVAVHEVRFWTNQPFYPAKPADYRGDFLDPMLVQMETDLQQGIVKEWLPVKALHTEENRAVIGYMAEGTFRLPAPYYVQAQQPFGVRIMVRDDVADFVGALGSLITVHLRGKDPFTGAPTSFGKLIELPLRIGEMQDYFFDDNRDAPIRDLILTEIVIAGKTMPRFGRWQPLDAINVQFLPPTGPSWTRDLFTDFSQGLTDQQGAVLIAAGLGLVPRYPVIHRPKRPYVLRPGDRFRVEAMFRGLDLPTTGYADFADYQTTIYCRVSGVQEGIDG